MSITIIAVAFFIFATVLGLPVSIAFIKQGLDEKTLSLYDTLVSFIKYLAVLLLVTAACFTVVKDMSGEEATFFWFLPAGIALILFYIFPIFKK